MLDKLKVAPVAYAQGMSDDGTVRPLPEDFDIKKILESNKIFLYNPFNSGLPLKEILPSSLRYKDLRDNFIVFPEEAAAIVNDRDHVMQKKFSALSGMANDFFEVAAMMFSRQLQVPKRDRRSGPVIDQDNMGLVVSPPKRKIEGPKLTAKPTMTP